MTKFDRDNEAAAMAAMNALEAAFGIICVLGGQEDRRAHGATLVQAGVRINQAKECLALYLTEGRSRDSGALQQSFIEETLAIREKAKADDARLKTH